MCNAEIRELIKKKRLFNYEIAEYLGIAESGFSKMLRTELTPEKKEKVLEAIEHISEHGKEACNA